MDHDRIENTMNEDVNNRFFDSDKESVTKVTSICGRDVLYRYLMLHWTSILILIRNEKVTLVCVLRLYDLEAKRICCT